MSDNAGSVSSVSETLAYYASLRMSFPGARIQPSSLDAFYAEAEKVKDQLPMTVVGEVGDGKCHGSLHCHVYDSKYCTTTVSVYPPPDDIVCSCANSFQSGYKASALTRTRWQSTMH